MLLRVFKKVFSDPIYILYSLFAAVFVVAIIVFAINFRLIAVVWSFTFFLSLFTTLPSVLGFNQFLYLVIVAMLFSISLSLSIYYLKHSRLSNLSSLSGLVVAILGLGCSSCGSLILTPILGLAAGGLLATLPLRGGEFAILGVVLLLWSLYTLIKKIDQPYG
ncbi:MAG: hypothetical protein AAB590_00105 [Patescibacteria group bacterium]